MQAMLAELDNDVREGRRSYDGMSQSGWWSEQDCQAFY